MMLQQSSIIKNLPKFPARTIKIFGGPGTGKTTRLLSIVQKELDCGVDIDRIGYFTFSKAAAMEVAERFSANPPWWRTIHSACCRMLGISRGQTMGKREYDLLRAKGWTIAEGGIRFEDSGAMDHGILLHCISLSRNSGRSLEDVVREKGREYDEVHPRNMERFLRDYEELKSSTGRFDYNDMLARYAFADQPTHPDLEVCIIDEAQDLSLLQWAAVRQLAKKSKRVYMAGDDDQSIYSFLGAAEYAFLDYPVDETDVLTKSYRCPAPIGQYATKLIGRLKRRQAKQIEWSDKPGWARTRGQLSMREVEESARKGTVMILCRHNYQVAGVSKALGQAAVPHSAKGFSLTNSRRTRAIVCYHQLAKGVRMNRTEVANMLNELGDDGNARAVRSTREIDDYSAAELSSHLRFDKPWDKMWSGSEHHRTLNRQLKRVIQKHGFDIVGTDPAVSVDTMHGSKGREADHVFVLSDCSRRVDDACYARVPSEVRLAYVATTRSRKTLTVVRSQKRNEMRLLFP